MNVKELFKATGLKQRWVASQAGISFCHLNRVINGAYKPSPRLAEKIEQLTGIDARILLGIPKPESGNGDEEVKT